MPLTRIHARPIGQNMPATVIPRDWKGYFRRLPRLKKLFWAYFLLLIFEGALRKWAVPQLSAPLLVIRDPVGMWIIWEAYRTHKWPARWSSAMALVTVPLMVLAVMQLIAGDNLIAELYGMRTYLLPFPVIFIMGENLDGEDLRRMGIFTLWMVLPMTLIEVGQYMTVPNSFLNAGAYVGAGQIGFAGDHVRASGTFSSTIGAVAFTILAAGFLFYAMMRDNYVKRWLLWADAFALVLSIPMQGSRGTVFELVILFGCVLLAGMMGFSQMARLIGIVVPLLLVGILVAQLPVFSSAMSLLTARLQNEGFAGQAEQSQIGSAVNTVIYRAITPIVTDLDLTASPQGLMGIGMGRGALAVNVLLQGSPIGVAGEVEFDREFYEMGPIAGVLFALFKLVLGVAVFAMALSKAREGEPLALLLIPAAVVQLLFAQLEQPTEQGFVVIGTAFCIAAAKSAMRPPARAQIQRPRVQPFRSRLQQG